LELALVWVHLPSGVAAVQGVVRNPDGGPTTGGSWVRGRPVGAGGIDVLFDGVEPPVNRLSPDPSGWAYPTPDVAQEAAQSKGWQLLTRADAVKVMIRQGYQLGSSSQPGHLLHADQADTVIWHNRQGVGSRPSPYIQAAFAVRPIQVPHVPPAVRQPAHQPA
jgi:hypothetical protein